MGGQGGRAVAAVVGGRQNFFRLLAEDVPFFLLKLRYRGDTLVEAVLNGAPVAL